MSKLKTLSFRVETMSLLNEVVNNALPYNAGVLYVPLNTLRCLLGQLADRCTELNDPVLNRICFDMTLYDLPKPTDPAYGVIMKRVYDEEKKYLKSKRKSK